MNVSAGFKVIVQNTEVYKNSKGPDLNVEYSYM